MGYVNRNGYIYEMYEYGYRSNIFDIINQYSFISSLNHVALLPSTSTARLVTPGKERTDPA